MKWHFGICPGHCTTDGREYALSLRPIKGAGFWKTSLTKVDNYYAKISFRGMCTVQKSIWATFRYFDVFLYETFSFIFCLGLDFFKWKKGANHCHMNNSYSVFIIHTLQAVLDPVLEFLLSISTCSFQGIIAY